MGGLSPSETVALAVSRPLIQRPAEHSNHLSKPSHNTLKRCNPSPWMERNPSEQVRGCGALRHLCLPGMMRVRHPITNLLQPKRLRRQDAEKRSGDSLVADATP